MTDTSKTLEIAASPVKMILLAVGGAAFVIVGWFLARATEGTGRYSREMVNLAGWAALVFFGAITLLIVWRLFTQRGTVVTLSPMGLTDIRVSLDVVAWPAVDRISTWSHSGQRIMIVALKPGEEAKLKLSTIARLTRGANAKLGADGLAVTAQGLKIGYDDLLSTTMAYAERHGGGLPGGR
jgi:hypothetical protein